MTISCLLLLLTYNLLRSEVGPLVCHLPAQFEIANLGVTNAKAKVMARR